MIPFTKMQGIGNDFVMVDAIRRSFNEWDLPALAVAMNDRRFGIGGDGLILALRGVDADFQMRMFNPDGSESEMCGNGIRCFAKFVRDLGYSNSDRISVETGAGTLLLTLDPDGRVEVDMGIAKLDRASIGMVPGGDTQFVEQPVQEYSATAVSLGNPHLVIFLDDVSGIDLAVVGPRLETDPMFANKTNVHFAQAVDRTHLIQRTWERGAGITLACGTGACAVGVAAFVTGRTERQVTVRLPGGELEIQYLESGRVRMTGPAETVFTGDYLEPEAVTDSLDLAGIREVELLEHS
jgi:diaminopimelate epimerase